MNNTSINFAFLRECYGNVKFDQKSMLQSIEHFNKLYPTAKVHVKALNSYCIKKLNTL